MEKGPIKFSICIPNYNYARYIGATIKSVLDQEKTAGAELEILVSDNRSTDDSIAVVEHFNDPRIRLTQNRWNLGFGGNLDRAAAKATGDRMILLSSDDLAEPNAIPIYCALAQALGAAAETALFASDQYVIDSEGQQQSVAHRDQRLWADATRHDELSALLGRTVLHVSAKNLLRRSMIHMRTPFAFATTCYPRALYEVVEGYGAAYLFNPDKAFAWKLMTVADDVYYVEEPLFGYRVHDHNQTAQQTQSGALKHLVDQYRATFDTAPETIRAAGLTRESLAAAFIKHDIVLRGLKHLAEGNRTLAKRGLFYGRATYPDLLRRSGGGWLLRLALLFGPVSTFILAKALPGAMRRYSARPESDTLR